MSHVPYPPDCADCPSPEECKAKNDCQVLRQIRHPRREGHSALRVKDGETIHEIQQAFLREVAERAAVLALLAGQPANVGAAVVLVVAKNADAEMVTKSVSGASIKVLDWVEISAALACLDDAYAKGKEIIAGDVAASAIAAAASKH